MATPVLHEKIAVRDGLRSRFGTFCASLTTLFRDKLRFSRFLTVFRPLAEGQKEVKEQDTPLQSTVGRDLAKLKHEVAPIINLNHVIALANAKATADLVIGDQLLAKDVPASSLLDLRKVLSQQVAGILEAIPVLDAARGFAPDADSGAGIFKAIQKTTTRTTPVVFGIELSPATDHHPAQVTQGTRHEVTGYKTEDEWSGAFTAAEKEATINRLTQLITAVDEAISRANMTEAPNAELAKPVLDFLLPATATATT